MTRKIVLIILLALLTTTSGCSPFKSVRTIDPQPLSSFDSIVIRDFTTDTTLVDEGYNLPGIIVGAIKRSRDTKPYYTAARKRELARILTDYIYAELKARRIFTNISKNGKPSGTTLVLEGKITRINVNSYHGNAPGHISIELEGILSSGYKGHELVMFSDENDGRTLDALKECAQHIASYLEKHR